MWLTLILQQLKHPLFFMRYSLSDSVSFIRNLPDESISRLTDETLVPLAGDARAVNVEEERALRSAEDEGQVLGSKLFPYSRFLAMTVALLIRSFNISCPVKVGINALRIL